MGIYHNIYICTLQIGILTCSNYYMYMYNHVHICKQIKHAPQQLVPPKPHQITFPQVAKSSKLAGKLGLNDVTWQPNASMITWVWQVTWSCTHCIRQTLNIFRIPFSILHEDEKDPKKATTRPEREPLIKNPVVLPEYLQRQIVPLGDTASDVERNGNLAVEQAVLRKQLEEVCLFCPVWFA